MIKGTPPLTDQHLEPEFLSQWTAGLGLILQEAPLLPHRLETTLPVEIRKAELCIWVILTIDREVRVGLRVPFDPAGLRNVRVRRSTKKEMEITAQGGFGDYRIRLEVYESPGTLLRFTSRLKPSGNLKVQALPRDMCVLNARLQPYASEGRLYTAQTLNSAPQVFFSVPGRPGGTLFYFQNLTALSEYFERTGSSRQSTVAVQWPEVGFALPGGEHPLQPGREIIIRDAFVETRNGLPESEGAAADTFLNSMARVYPHLPQPPASYYDWPAAAQKALRTLSTASGCSRQLKGRRYLNAYTNSTEKPPESMVQLALAVPLQEYGTWCGRDPSLLKDLHHVAESFYHAKLKTILRWLGGQPFAKSEPSEEEKKFRMDSWYILHTMMNYGRWAEMGHTGARKVFLASVDSIIATARLFAYDWPVFYDQRDHRVSKQETQPGAGGERDAGGLYIDVMLRAYHMTHEVRFLEEAEAAADNLHRMAFGMLYQANNTALGAAALAELWRITGKSIYRELSCVAVASLLRAC